MSDLIAALAMYDWPEVQAANDRLWSFLAGRLREAGIEAPARLDRTQGHREPWLSPRLLMAQTCGFPFATQLVGRVQLVGTPCYAADGCQGASYSSLIVVNKQSPFAGLSDLAGSSAAINSTDSQSGYWALRAAVAQTPGAAAPARLLLSGGHRHSLRLVAGGAADIASIDAVCFELAKRHEHEAFSQLRVIGVSPSAPGLPVIAALEAPKETIEALRLAWAEAADAPELAEVRKEICLSGFECLEPQAYDRILALRASALGVAFPEVSA